MDKALRHIGYAFSWLMSCSGVNGIIGGGGLPQFPDITSYNTFRFWELLMYVYSNKVNKPKNPHGAPGLLRWLSSCGAGPPRPIIISGQWIHHLWSTLSASKNNAELYLVLEKNSKVFRYSIVWSEENKIFPHIIRNSRHFQLFLKLFLLL